MFDQNFQHPNARPFELGFDRADKSAVLLLHGFTGSPGHMRPLGEALFEAGYAVSGILLPGHGLTLADMEKTRAEEWLAAARDEALRLRNRFGKLVVGGLSMGGVLALILGAEGLADCVLSYAAPVRIHNRFAPLSRFIWPIVRYTRWKPTAAPEGFLEDYDYGYPRTPIRKTPDLLRLMRRAEAGLGSIRAPILVVQSNMDETVRPESARIICDGAVSAAEKKILWLERSGHVVTLGPERDAVFAETLRFLSNAGF